MYYPNVERVILIFILNVLKIIVQLIQMFILKIKLYANPNMIIVILINFIKQIAVIILMKNFYLDMKIVRYILIVVMILYTFITKRHIYIIIILVLANVLIRHFQMMIMEFVNITILII